MTKGRGTRKVIAYDVVSFNCVILTWRNLWWFSGDQPVTLGVTASGSYCLIFMRLDSRCPERNCFWTESAPFPPISPTLAKTKVATAPPSLPYSHDLTVLGKVGWKCHPPSSPAMAFIVGHLFQPQWIGERLHSCLCLDAPYPGQRCTCQASAWASACSCSRDCHRATVID